MIDSFSAWTATICSRSNARRIPSSSVPSSAMGKSSTPLLHMNALNPMTPQSVRSCMWVRLSAHRPPQRPKSSSELAFAKFHFAKKPPLSSTGGCALSGMSKKDVTPPPANARLP